MARKAKLKVYRTPIGFHDAYVAAPSQRAALEAWGTEANLFARGAAELVTDENLTREPLENPGKIIKRSRGSISEQLAALPDDRPKRTKPTASERHESKTTPKTAPRPKSKPKPRPSRAELDKAQRLLDDLVTKQDAEEAELRARERALAKERQELERSHQRDRREAERALEKQREVHSEALNRWIDEQQVSD